MFGCVPVSEVLVELMLDRCYVFIRDSSDLVDISTSATVTFILAVVFGTCFLIAATTSWVYGMVRGVWHGYVEHNPMPMLM